MTPNTMLAHSLLPGVTRHLRTVPREHGFHYPTFSLLLNLDRADELDAYWPMLSVSAPWACMRLPVERYFDFSAGQLKERVLRFCRQRSESFAPDKVLLLTTPTLFGYTFNPVSFYFFYDNSGAVVGHGAEVNNTFGERHFYFFDQNSLMKHSNGRYSYRVGKDFHVSPFLQYDGYQEYDFRLTEVEVEVRVRVYTEAGGMYFAELRGHRKPLSWTRVATSPFQYPLRMLCTMPRILWQAARLHYEKDLPVYRKPAPLHENTLRAVHPNFIEAAATRRVLARLQQATKGALLLLLPYGERIAVGAAASDSAALGMARLEVHHPRFFSSVALHGALGFAESYMRGEWSTANLPAVLEFFLDNYEELIEKESILWKLRRVRDRAFHLARRNTASGSKRNIAAHYDLSNEFFALFLDSTMTYSSARFLSPYDSLEEAQRNKMDELIRLADIRDGDDVLEIGTGWGGFALHLAKERDVRIRSVTISQQQYEYAKALIEREGLSARIDVQLCDYRDIEGQFDRIVSIEMIEAVGRDHLDTYFRKCGELLREDGLAAIQAITIRDHHYARYSRQVDFIQRYIFPGSHVPSLTALLESSGRASKLVLQDLTPLSFDYAQTLKLWRERFLRARSDVQALGFNDDFIRMWEYYLAYCEVGFRSQFLGTFQLVFSRVLNRRLRRQFDASDHR